MRIARPALALSLMAAVWPARTRHAGRGPGLAGADDARRWRRANTTGSSRIPIAAKARRCASCIAWKASAASSGSSRSTAADARSSARRARSMRTCLIGVSCSSSRVPTRARCSRRCRRRAPSSRPSICSRCARAVATAGPRRARRSRSGHATHTDTATGSGWTRRQRCRCARRSATGRAAARADPVHQARHAHEPAARETEPSVDASGFRWVRSARPVADRRVVATWRPLKVPPGFRLVGSRLQSLPGHPMPVQHLVFSDGFASVSVFIEPGSRNATGTGRGLAHGRGEHVYDDRAGVHHHCRGGGAADHGPRHRNFACAGRGQRRRPATVSIDSPDGNPDARP